jgi:hypothetical protein
MGDGIGKQHFHKINQPLYAGVLSFEGLHTQHAV